MVGHAESAGRRTTTEILGLRIRAIGLQRLEHEARRAEIVDSNAATVNALLVHERQQVLTETVAAHSADVANRKPRRLNPTATLSSAPAATRLKCRTLASGPVSAAMNKAMASPTVITSSA